MKWPIQTLASFRICGICLLLAGCAAHATEQPVAAPPPDAETVLVTYRVIPGKEQQLRQILRDVWKEYQANRLVLPAPHIIVEGQDSGGKERLVEIFSWVSHSAPEHVPDSVNKLWDQMRECCETRDGQPGVDIGEVDIVVPSADEK